MEKLLTDTLAVTVKDRLVTIAGLRRRLRLRDLSRRQIDDLVRCGDLPAPVQTGLDGGPLWRLSDLGAVIAVCISAHQARVAAQGAGAWA